MSQPSFLARRTFGAPNYFIIALVMAFLLALVPRGARQALESNTNNVKDWLPASYPESADLRWFQRHFVGEQFALVTYDGCTLGNHEALTLLARKLVPPPRQGVEAEAEGDATGDPAVAQPPDPVPPPRAEEGPSKWFSRVMTGPEMLKELTSGGQAFSRTEALERLEGALFGPPREFTEDGQPVQESRPTCLIVNLSREATSNNKNMRAAIEAVQDVAVNQCAIPPEDLRMGGPPVDNVAIDVEGERTLFRLALLSGVVGLMLAYWCFRSLKLMALVFAVGVSSAAMSLALVFYFGVYESVAYGGARLGLVDAILMSMPPVVYVLGISGAIHIINYYKDARRETGLHGAAEKALWHGWGPCTLAALTTAVGLASLYTSDITPIKKFGAFTAVAVLGTLGILFTVLPVALHRFPLKQRELRVGEKRAPREGGHGFSIAGVLERVGGFIVRHHAAVSVVCLLMMGIFAAGLLKIQTSVQLLKLFDEDADIIHDYTWLEENIGNLVPMEVVVAIDEQQTRTGEPGEPAETESDVYRLSYLERVELVRRIQERMERLPEIGKAMALPTFVPDLETGGFQDAGKRLLLERRLAEEVQGSNEYVTKETVTADKLDQSEPNAGTGRELWRISARVRALDDGAGGEVDYGRFVATLRSQIEPVLEAYRQRDRILASLHDRGHRLAESKLLLLYADPEVETNQPPPGSEEYLLAELLTDSLDPEARRQGEAFVAPFNLATQRQALTDEARLGRLRSELARFDAIVMMGGMDPTAAQKLAGGEVPLIDLSVEVAPPGSPAKWQVASPNPLPVGAVYTGVVPLVYKTQRQLLVSLRESMAWATVLIAGVMVVVLRSVGAGFAAMIPNVFPIAMVFGALGWLGVKVDIGIMMSASVALGVAVDDTIHFVWWFQHGIREGMDRKSAVIYAYDRCGTAMLQTTIVAGLGLAVFGASTFTPTQQFGFMMITILSAALVGDLVLLPALLAGPIGKFFSNRIARRLQAQAVRKEVETGTRAFAPHTGRRRHDPAHRSASAS